MLRAMKKAENIRQAKAQPTGATVTGVLPFRGCGGSAANARRL